MEETGLVVEIDSVINIASNFLGPNIHPLNIALLAHPVGGEAKGGDDIDLVEWFTYGDELPEIAFDGDSFLIEYYFSAPFGGLRVDPRFARWPQNETL